MRGWPKRSYLSFDRLTSQEVAWYQSKVGKQTKLYCRINKPHHALFNWYWTQQLNLNAQCPTTVRKTQREASNEGQQRDVPFETLMTNGLECKSMIGLTVPHQPCGVSLMVWSQLRRMKKGMWWLRKTMRRQWTRVHNPNLRYYMFELVYMINDLMYEAWNLCHFLKLKSHSFFTHFADKM